jgi:hypothetical protein
MHTAYFGRELERVHAKGALTSCMTPTKKQDMTPACGTYGDHGGQDGININDNRANNSDNISDNINNRDARASRRVEELATRHRTLYALDASWVASYTGPMISMLCV